MKFNLKNITLSILLTISLCGKAEVVYNRGLYFRSFEVDQDKRTGLNLTPQKQLVFPKGFTLQFEIQLRKEDQNFGYVFRIIANDSINIDLVSDVSSDKYLFSLVSGTKSLINTRISEINSFKIGTWMKVVFSIDPGKNEVTLQIGDLKKKEHFESKRLRSFQLNFGGNQHTAFSTTDVPPMSIRDIKIFDRDKNLYRYWKLEKHSTNAVYDECSKSKAECINSSWNIDSHVKWQQKAHFVFPYSNPQLAFNDDTEQLYIVKGKYITVYNSLSGQIDSITAIKGEAYNCSSNQLVFNKKTHHLISYSFENNNLSLFDFKLRKWTNESSQKILTNYWHHSKYFNQSDSTLLTIGGYGYHKYKGVMMQYPLKTKEWKIQDISTAITPRYLGSLGDAGNGELFYFGGYGSKTGNQEEYPRNYYDLYKINLKTREIKKIWELNVPKDHFTNGNSLVVNKEKGVFYTLSYPNNRYSSMIQLNEFSINKPEFSITGDTIPYKFNDTESYCDLYYCPKSARLIAVTAVSKNNSSEVNVYSIAYPPLQEKDILQKETTGSFWNWYYCLFIFAFIPLYTIFRKKKKSVNSISLNNNMSENTDPEFKYEMIERELKPSSVNLLGYFQIIDKDSRDITGSFSQTLSQILSLILLFTIKNGNGISSQELADILWFDKDSESARNNRNVNFSKLRLLLKNVGDIELVSNNSYWSISLGKEFFCDYKSVIYLMNLINKSTEVNKDIVNEFLKIAARGVLLPNLQIEWLDSFKGSYTNSVIETLNHLTHSIEIKKDTVLLLKISEVILIHDAIDEEAAKLKVNCLFTLGKKGQAKQGYEKFVEDYKNLMGTDYKDSFDKFRNLIL